MAWRKSAETHIKVVIVPQVLDLLDSPDTRRRSFTIQFLILPFRKVLDILIDQGWSSLACHLYLNPAHQATHKLYNNHVLHYPAWHVWWSWIFDLRVPQAWRYPLGLASLIPATPTTLQKQMPMQPSSLRLVVWRSASSMAVWPLFCPSKIGPMLASQEPSPPPLGQSAGGTTIWILFKTSVSMGKTW